MKSPANPYVGPRTFLENERLYGRDRELADLMDLLIAERIVLLYSPSGAGKSSLLNAGLIPAMKARGFTVPRVIRVSVQPPKGAEDNRYGLSMMVSLKTEGQPVDAGRLTLSQFLDAGSKGSLLVFDQFEEVITVDPFNVKARVRFFDEIGEALRDRGRWAVFSMREDYLARLDPYLRRVPTHLSNTFRLDLLSIDASVEAIRMHMWTDESHKNPVDVDFSLTAAQKLAGNLSGLNPDVNLETNPEALTGRFVEPVQLQVACFDLWERLPEGTRQITPDHIEKVANIDQALGQYYAREAAKLAQAELKRTSLNAQTSDMTARALKRTERDIRVWFGEELIRGGIRAQVMRGDGLSGEAVDLLEAAHLVRSESRLGSTWVELAHDRLIKPVQKNNALWLDQNLSELQKRAELWDQQKRDGALLISESETLNRWERDDPPAPQSLEGDFLKASRAAEKERLQAEQRRLRDIRIDRILKAGAVVLTLLLAVAVWAFLNARKSQAAAMISAAQAAQALAEYDLSVVPNYVDGGQMAQASAYLARALRGNPSSPRARAWAAAFLSRGNLRIPSLEVDHQAPITGLYFSADGTRMLTSSARGSSHVWDLKTKQSVGPSLPGSLEAELNRDGTLAVLWDPLNNADSSGHVYDVATGKELGRAAGSKSGLLSTAVGDVKFSGNSRQVFTRSQDGIRLWDIDAQKVVRSPRILGKIQYAAFNADRSIVLILLQRSALVWRVSDTSGGNFPEKDFTSPILSAALSSDGRLAAIVSGNKAYLWNIASGALTSLDNSDKADTVGFTADQQQVVLVGDSKVRLWNVKTGRPGPFWKSGDTVLDFQSGGQVFVEESDEDILLRDIGTFQPVARVLTRGQLDNWKLSQDGHTLATATGGRTQAEVWDMTPGPAPMPPSQEEKSSATEVPALTAAQIDGMVAGWQNKPGPRFTSGVVSRDGSKVLLMKDAVFGIDEPPEVRDAKTGALIMPILLGGAAGTQAGAKFAGALSDDGRLAAVSASTGNAQVFDLTTRQQVGQPWTQMTGIQALRFTPDASHLIIANSDLTARLFYVPLGSIVGDPVIHAGPVTQISLSADGSMALTTSGSNTVAWDVFLGSGSSGSGSSKDGDALADLAEAAGGMRLAPGGSAPEMIPLAQRLSLIQNLSPQLSVLDPRVAAAISRFQAALQKR